MDDQRHVGIQASRTHARGETHRFKFNTRVEFRQHAGGRCQAEAAGGRADAVATVITGTLRLISSRDMWPVLDALE